MANDLQNTTGVQQSVSNSLIPADILGVGAKYANEEVFTGMSGSGFLPRIQLTTGSSKLVQRGKASGNGFLLVRGSDNIVRDFGDTFDCLVVGWRPKAIKFVGDTAMSYYNPRSPDFQAVEREGDKKPRPKGFLYGPEFLVLLPEINEIATFHFNNPTLRLRAGDMRSMMGQATSLSVEMVEKGGNIWPAPVITACSTPLAMPQGEELDNLMAKLRVQKEKFDNPPENAVEEVTDAEPAAAGVAPTGDGRVR